MATGIYRAAVEEHFRAGHYLIFGPGRRVEVHEHQWQVRAVVEGREVDHAGMVMDFQVLGRLLKEAVEPLSSVPIINDLEAFRGVNPSTERIAQYIFERLAGQISGSAVLREVVVWETQRCRASYGLQLGIDDN